jgi:DNA polymerase elongation subunit (family B)
MGYLFFDIESFVDPEEERSGLNPFHKNSKVIVISYNYYAQTMYPLAHQIKKPTFLYEWEIGSEKELLKQFYVTVKRIYLSDPNLKIIGFNHLAYDLNYLLARMSFHEIAPPKEIFDILISCPRHVDLAQIGMALSEKTKEASDFRCISQKVINSYFDIPIKEDSGKDVSKYYLKKNYAKIQKYCEEEFTFELLYSSIIEYFLHLAK